MEQSLFKKYDVHPAIAAESPVYKKWVYSQARPVDTSNPREASLVRDLSAIMQHSLSEYGWHAVSSNNIYWNGTDEPIRVIMVPHLQFRHNLAIANPQIKEYSGEPIESKEGCGSFPGALYTVKRTSFVKLYGWLRVGIEFLPVELEYGSRTSNIEDIKSAVDYLTLEQKLSKATYVQHEVDHLDGIVIADKGVLSTAEDIEECRKIADMLARMDSSLF